MSDLKTTQEKLLATPTSGVSSEHSAYYRRLLSAGYKGHIQGSIGGATLYGSIGLVVGALVGIPLLYPLGASALLLIPALAGLGGLYGAETFADIGKTAAIIAESAETNEKRRFLLERFHETDNQVEKQEIIKQLSEQLESKSPEKVFHWKTVLIGAAMGAALILGIVLIANFTGFSAIPGVTELMTNIHFAAHPYIFSTAATAIGALSGGIIGLDREYVRRWMDGAESIVSDPNRTEKELAARAQEIQKLKEAATRGEYSTASIDESRIAAPSHASEMAAQAQHSAHQARNAAAELPDSALFSAGKPGTIVSNVANENRAVPLDRAVGA